MHYWADLPFESEPNSDLGKNVCVTMLDVAGWSKDDPVLTPTTTFFDRLLARRWLPPMCHSNAS